MSESLVGRENVYTCQKCGGFTNTIHVDDGVTPFMLDCRAAQPKGKGKCDGMAMSAMYPRGPRPPWIPEPKWEWYRPADDEPLKEWEREHVAQGGVLLRYRGETPKKETTPPARPSSGRGE